MTTFGQDWTGGAKIVAAVETEAAAPAAVADEGGFEGEEGEEGEREAEEPEGDDGEMAGRAGGEVGGAAEGTGTRSECESEEVELLGSGKRGERRLQ